MFFKPPEVKAISRYSDFGSHLGPRTFGVMLAIAFCIHAAILIAYAMMPHTKVLSIPVRVLNINLGTGVNEPAPASEQPLPEQMRVASAVKPLPDESAAAQKSPQLALDKAIAGEKVEAHATAQKGSKEKMTAGDKKAAAAVKGPTFAMPKKYVRETGASPIKTKPNEKKEEVAQRYEQVISLWIRQHKIYPQEAKDHHAQGVGTVHVVVNRQGHITYYAIESSTGDAFLDQAAMSMVRASDPVPPIPDDYDPEEESFAFNITLSWELEKPK